MNGRTFFYLATSYTKHPDGRDAAFDMAANATQLLMRAFIPVFSPIVHSHPLAEAFDLPQDHDFWMAADVPMMIAAHGCIVLKDGGWEVSRGVQEEIARFQAMEKPILYMTPGIVPHGAMDGHEDPPPLPPVRKKAKVLKFTKKEA